DCTVLIVDEAGLLSSRKMHGLLTAADNAGAKVLFTGNRDQLQAIGAGSGLRLVTHAVEAAKVQTIVRQHDPWAREAVTAFGQGDAKAGLDAFAGRELLKEADGPAAAIKAVVNHVQNTLMGEYPEEAIIIARTNAEIAAIGREVRARLRENGLLKGPDVEIDAVTPSGHTNRLVLSEGDRIRFLVRNDGLGVVNGTVGTVTNIFMTDNSTKEQPSPRIEIEAKIGDRTIRFDTSELADDKGRTRLGWAYASTIYGAQGVTVDTAAVLLTPSFDRHDIYVAASRARKETLLVVDRGQVDREMHSSSSVSSDPDPESRREWLAHRLSQQHVKETTLDVGRRVTNNIQFEQTAEDTLKSRDNKHSSAHKHGQQRAWENDYAF
ncbi:MAG: AAA family ATPase, partial [Roseibium sp.]|uniref:ATP-dependent DNA helicase n=1 Tax=Roseibium sp. TaxID=1936156 RepID=UPI003299252E